MTPDDELNGAISIVYEGEKVQYLYSCSVQFNTTLKGKYQVKSQSSGRPLQSFTLARNPFYKYEYRALLGPCAYGNCKVRTG